MIKKEAEKISDYFCEKGWVSSELREWCVYSIEKRIGMSIFWFLVILWMLFSEKTIETVSYVFPFYFIRRRAGGYHTKKPSTCLIVSLALVIFVTVFAGKALDEISLRTLLILDTFVVVIIVFLKPVYPVQANFTEEEKKANIKYKNYLIAVIYLLQLISVKVFNASVLVHSFIGISFAAITIIIPKLLKEDKNEKT